ncbi:MAG: hypothetical protein IKI31_04410 [Treponema sp.]|nr:hypothetical protein [Treponema sp.]
MVKSSDNQNNFFSPFISITPHITNIAATILFLLLLQVGMLFITKSYLSLFVIASSTLATFAAGLVIKFYANDESFSFLLSTIQGLLIGMLLPESFPILSVFFITFLVFVISHYKVPKASASWLNEVLLVVCISWIVGQNSFPEMHATLEVLQAKNPSLFLIEDGVYRLRILTGLLQMHSITLSFLF